MHKTVWTVLLLLFWWAAEPFSQVQAAAGSSLLIDARGILEKKLALLDGRAIPAGGTGGQTVDRNRETVEIARRTAGEREVHPVRSARKKAETRRPVLFYHGPNDRKRVALTFDDGPDWKYTPRILDVLKRENVRATFFLVGRMAEKRPDLVRRMVREGHVVANHTWNHPDLTGLSPSRVREEVDRTNRIIAQMTGRTPLLFRAPYGSLNRRVERIVGEAGMVIVHWNVDTRDWTGRSSERIFRTVRRHAGPGAIILQHSGGGTRDNTVEALPRIIADLKKRGYALVTVPELLRVPAYRNASLRREPGSNDSRAGRMGFVRGREGHSRRPGFPVQSPAGDGRDRPVDGFSRTPILGSD